MTERISNRYDKFLDEDMGGSEDATKWKSHIDGCSPSHYHDLSNSSKALCPCRIFRCLGMDRQIPIGRFLGDREHFVMEFLFLSDNFGYLGHDQRQKPETFRSRTLFLTTLIAISYVSMQLRHKIGYIILFPILYNAYYTHREKFNRRNVIFIQGCTFAALLLYNIYSL